MKRRNFAKTLSALILCFAMLFGLLSVSASAYNKEFVSETHDVFKSTSATLAPGVEQYINYAYAKDGNQMVYYVTVADISRDDVVVQTSYKDQYRNKVLGMSKLTEQVASANEYYSDPASPQFISEYYNVVAGVNASFYNMTTGQPSGITYIDGVSFGTASYDNFFAILKDGSAVIDYRANEKNYTGDRAIMQAAGGSQWLVRNGKDVTSSASGSYNTDRHCRTSVGITAEGKVVFMVLDGRQEPFSCGGSMHEIAQIMLEAGCVAAINLDGGGSTTYVAKQEGEDSVSIVNRPSDGSERSISAGLIIASTAAPSDAFDRAALTPEHEFITVNAKTAISAKGISPSGTAAEIPADAVLKLADESFGTIENGIFVPAKTGDAVIQMVYNGKTVGETTVHIVVPDEIAFTSTALATPYGKSSEIGLTLTYGEFGYAVAFDAADIEFSLSDGKFGSVSGLTFNATADTSVTGSGEITATVVGTSVSATVPLNVGKGSEVLFDFEDANVDRWGFFDYYNADVSTTISVADAKNGKVHSGNYSMAYSVDFSQLTYYEDYITSMMTYNADSIKAHGLGTDADGVQMYGTPDDYVDITGATGLGFWVYLPDEVDIAGLNPRFVFGYKKTATDAWTRGSTAMTEFLINREGMGSDGWYYFYADLSAFSGYYAMSMQNNRLSCTSSKNGYKAERYYGAMVEWYIEDRAWKNNKTKSYTGKFTLFIDDITVDYSSVVDDREPPVFGEVSYAATGMSDSAILKDNATIIYNGVDFAASVSENTKKSNATGINPASAKAYIDGNDVAAEYKNGKITVLNPVDFADGVHTVKFEIADRQGNVSHIVRTFTMDTGSSENTVKVLPRDADMTSTLVGSLYYIDIVATDISAVNTVSVTLKVNNVNDWEPAGITTAGGFSSEYMFDPADNGILELTLRKTSTVSDRGEAVIASVPIRAWYPHNALGKDSNWIITQKKCVYPMDIQLLTKAGRVVFEDGTFGTFSSAKIQIDSEAMCAYGYIGVNKGNEGGTLNVTSWHEHTAVALADKAATCTEAGYTGRTFCEVCNSVVDWGTTVPATGHSYALVDGVLKCSECGDLFNGIWTDGREYVNGVAFSGYILEDGVYYTLTEGVRGGVYTGLVQTDGKWGYSKLGVLSGGWVMIDDVWYYFDTTTLTSVETYSNGKVTFEFEENGRLISGQWYATSEGTRYYYGPNYYGHGWHTIDGYDYYFGDANVEPGYRYEGLKYVINSNSHTPQWYDFGTDGKAVKLDSTGLLTVEGRTYYLVNGISQTGLQLIDGKYYYFSGTYEAKKNVVYVSSAKGNGLLPEGYYLFKEDCSMADEEFGVWQNALRYIRKGQPCFAGLILNAEGKIIYIGSDCTLGKGICTVPANKTNGLLAEGTYAFGEDGVLIDNAFAMWQGNMCYMRNGQPYAAGLVRIGSDIYYVRSSCQAATGMYWVSPDKTNGILETGFYLFADNGALIDGRFADWKGEECYIKMGQPYYAGVIEYNGKLIYVGSNCKMNTGVCYITKAAGNGILEEGYYYFKEDGELLSSGFAKWTDGVTYYFENGQRCAAGVVEVDGSVYYINSGCRPVTGKYFVSANKGNGILEEGYYTFDANGVLISG